MVKRRKSKPGKAEEKANGAVAADQLEKPEIEPESPAAEEKEPEIGPRSAKSDLPEVEESATRHGITLEHHQRLLAEFDNFRKRTDRERKRIDLWARAEVLTAVLPILDDFDRARKASPPEDNSFDKEGMLIIIDRLAEILTKEGLNAVKANPGEVFDPEIHEAILMIPSTDIPAGCVAEVLETGYRVKERLLRPAKVVVAREPDTQQE